MGEKMNPCPFCGGSPVFRKTGRNGHYIACSICDSSSTLFTAAKDDVRDLLIETWNRRPSTTNISAHLDADSGWLSIDSAPKDGTEVLLFQEGQRNVARWLKSAVGPVWCTPDSHALYRPTHWMPLPAAPAKQGGSHD